jgi:hypothetical protein
MIDVAFFGKIPRFDDEIIVDCFRCFGQIVSKSNDDVSMRDDEPLVII